MTAPLWLWMLASALWGAGLVALVTHSILRQLRQARTEWFGTEHFYIGQVERLRGDAHSLATWLILARDRIREAEQLFGDQSGAGVDVWKRRIRETVWEVKRADIAERDPQYIDPGRGPAI